MKLLTQYFGVLRKEYKAEGGTRWSLLSKLVISPAVSAITVAVLYSGFFRSNGHIQLGPLTEENYSIHIALGFLVHTYLNSGYYFLSHKIIHEWASHTLPLFWLLPCNRWLQIFGTSSIDAFRCFIFTLIVLGLLFFKQQFDILSILIAFAVFVMSFVTGLLLGVIRCYLFLRNNGKSDGLDQLYLVSIFLGCLYIPKEILPPTISWVCELNPIYHLGALFRSPHFGVDSKLSIGVSIVTVVLLFSSCQLLWHFRKHYILDKSFR